MRTVYILCGFPGSGKSTWARKMVESGGKIAVINRDSIRTMFGAGKYIYDKYLEIAVKNVSVLCLRHLLTAGYDVIIDETNLTKDKRRDLIEEANSGIECNILIIWFTESEKNLDRRMNDPRGYPREKWDEVISGMKKIFEPPEESEGVRIEKVE